MPNNNSPIVIAYTLNQPNRILEKLNLREESSLKNYVAGNETKNIIYN